MSTGGQAQRQNADATQNSGGNVVGKAPSGKLHQPPAIFGKSGQPDNQSTNRGKGRT
jgi:hypothetical protein